MLSLLNLVEEALLISDKAGTLLKQEELGKFISDEEIANRIIQLKSDNDADPKCCPTLQKVTDILFQTAQAYNRSINPDDAKKAIETLQSALIDFNKFVECDFMVNVSNFIGDLRIKDFQEFTKQISAENLELNRENSELSLELQRLKGKYRNLEEENRKLKYQHFSSEKPPTHQIAPALFFKKAAVTLQEEIITPPTRKNSVGLTPLMTEVD